MSIECRGSHPCNQNRSKYSSARLLTLGKIPFQMLLAHLLIDHIKNGWNHSPLSFFTYNPIYRCDQSNNWPILTNYKQNWNSNFERYRFNMRASLMKLLSPYYTCHAATPVMKVCPWLRFVELYGGAYLSIIWIFQNEWHFIRWYFFKFYFNKRLFHRKIKHKAHDMVSTVLWIINHKY